MSGRHHESTPALDSTANATTPSSSFASNATPRRNPHRTRTDDLDDSLAAAASRPSSAPLSSSPASTTPASYGSKSSIPSHVLSGGSNRLSRRHNRPALASSGFGGNPTAAANSPGANNEATTSSAGGRPATMYQTVTWKENLDAFHRRLRRGSLSMDISQAEDEMLAASSRAAQANGRGSSALDANQAQIDESRFLLDGGGTAGHDDTLHKPVSYGTLGHGDYNNTTNDHTLTGGHPLNTTTIPHYHNHYDPTSGSASQSHAAATAQAAVDPPAFPVTLNPALAAKKPSSKLDTFSGVFIPCVLSIWGIILFLRFGFIIGQVGVVGTMAMFVVGYLIDVLTTFSLSAISSNGTVRGGGPYYLISRSLGPEFGGSIGLIYFLGCILSGGMNVLGFVEPLMANFGEASGTVYRVLPEGAIWQFMYGTVLLVLCTLICLVGAKLFSKTSLALATIIFLSTVSIFVSFALVPAFTIPERNIEYTGFSLETLKENLWPQFTADGPDGPMFNFQVVFGILFPACTGILAGASMSGDLENPSRSIPRGTLWAVGSTFVVYTAIVVLMGGSIARSSMHTDMSILQDIALSPLFIASGALATSIFATLGSVIGAAKILQAIARDNLLPILSVFSQGTPKTDEPTLAVLLTYVLTQLCLFVPNMNAIAAFVSLSTLLTFAILNLACFLLKVGSAPNFRPRFRFFQWWTAFCGMILCVMTMSFMDLGKTVLSGLLTAMLFIWIHYWSPPKRWGDVTQSLIYHQVRKYLLRLDSRKDHVKFWRPQILLLVHHPRSEYRLIQFCNHLKKGALYVLGHVIVGDLRDLISEYKRQQSAWLKFVDVLKIKAFVNISVADSVRIGARNLLLSTGLGGMRPNIVVLGSFNLKRYLRETKGDEGDCQFSPQAVASAMPFALPASPPVPPPLPRSPKDDHRSPLHTLLNIPITLPTDSIRAESPISITDYVSIIEDVLALNKAVAIAYGFDRLELPEDSCSRSARGMFDFGAKPPKRYASIKTQHSPYHPHHRGHRNRHDESDSDSSSDEGNDDDHHHNFLQRSIQNVSSLFDRSKANGESDGYGKESTSLLHRRSSRPHSLYKSTAAKTQKKKYIDLWPMQMSVVQTVQDRRASRDFDTAAGGSPYHQQHGSTSSGKPQQQQDILTNFDTYTMVLQMGCILHMVPYWKENYILRVMVFVEYEQDVEPEEKRLEELLENLRIPAQVKVMCLDRGDSETYLQLVCGIEDDFQGDQEGETPQEYPSLHQQEAAPAVASAVHDGDSPFVGPPNMNPGWHQSFSSSPSAEHQQQLNETIPSAEPTPASSHARLSPVPHTMTAFSPPSAAVVAAADNSFRTINPLATPRMRTLSHRGSMPQISTSPKGVAAADPSTIASLHDRGLSESSTAPSLRINTAVSPRLRHSGALTTAPVGGNTANLQHHRSLMVAGTTTTGGIRNRPRHFSISTGSGTGISRVMTGDADRLGTSVPLSMSMNYRLGVPHPKQYFDPQGMQSESESDSMASDDDDNALNGSGGITGAAPPLGGGGEHHQDQQDVSGLHYRPSQLSQGLVPTMTTAMIGTAQDHNNPYVVDDDLGFDSPHLTALRPNSTVSPFLQPSLEDNPWATSAPNVTSSSSGPPPVMRPSPRIGSTAAFTSLEVTPEIDEEEEEDYDKEEKETKKKNGDGRRIGMPPRQPSGLGIQFARQQQLQLEQQQQDIASRRAPAATGPGASFEEHQGEYNHAGRGGDALLGHGHDPYSSINIGSEATIGTDLSRTVSVGMDDDLIAPQQQTIVADGDTPLPAFVRDSSTSSYGSPMMPRLQFDHLSPEDQLQIVNELMRVHSSSETTSILFTTVPAPEPGTCLSEESSIAYLESMEILMQDIKIPVLLIHAKSLTVTMTL